MQPSPARGALRAERSPGTENRFGRNPNVVWDRERKNQKIFQFSKENPNPFEKNRSEKIKKINGILKTYLLVEQKCFETEILNFQNSWSFQKSEKIANFPKENPNFLKIFFDQYFFKNLSPCRTKSKFYF